MPYDPSGHQLLSAAAAALDTETLAAQAEAAETLLRRGSLSLADTSFRVGSDEFNRATLAVVFQVNHQVSRGDDLGEVKSWRRGDRSVEYRDGAGASGLISARAQSIIDGLIPLEVSRGDWPVAGPLR